MTAKMENKMEKKSSVKKRARKPAPGFALISHDLALGREHGVRFIAGADEAGRGSLAGPLVAAAVCLDLDCLFEKRNELARLDDSKRLSALLREELYDIVRSCAVSFSLQVIEPRVIDAAGLHVSNLAALAAALEEVSPPAELRLSDHYKLDLGDALAITKGDAQSCAIACAAILAKVSRDRIMCEYEDLYPDYGFARNVGYMTAAHQEAVRRHGPTPLHRLSFAAACYTSSTLS